MKPFRFINQENKESVFVWIGGAHCFITFFLMFNPFNAEFPREPGVFDWLFQVFQWPLAPLYIHLNFDVGGLVLVFPLNSALWAFCLYLVWQGCFGSDAV